MALEAASRDSERHGQAAWSVKWSVERRDTFRRAIWTTRRHGRTFRSGRVVGKRPRRSARRPAPLLRFGALHSFYASPWEFGWEAIVALATIGLALVTSILAGMTWWLARQTKSLVSAAKDELKSVADEIEISRQTMAEVREQTAAAREQASVSARMTRGSWPPRSGSGITVVAPPSCRDASRLNL
jgi:hypothetical protein